MVILSPAEAQRQLTAHIKRITILSNEELSVILPASGWMGRDMMRNRDASIPLEVFKVLWAKRKRIFNR